MTKHEFTLENLPYWSELPLREFIAEVVHRMKTEILVVEEFMHVILEDSKANSLDLDDIDLTEFGDNTVGTGCTLVLERLDTLLKILDTTNEYAAVRDSEDSDIGEDG
jgi:hypothetical protein